MEWEHFTWMGNITSIHTYHNGLIQWKSIIKHLHTWHYIMRPFFTQSEQSTSPMRDVGGKKYCYKYYNMTLIVLMWEIFNVVVVDVFFILKSLKISLHACHERRGSFKKIHHNIYTNIYKHIPSLYSPSLPRYHVCRIEGKKV